MIARRSWALPFRPGPLLSLHRGKVCAALPLIACAAIVLAACIILSMMTTRSTVQHGMAERSDDLPADQPAAHGSPSSSFSL